MLDEDAHCSTKTYNFFKVKSSNVLANQDVNKHLCTWCCDLKAKALHCGKCAKLRTMAASNNRDHTPRSLYYCSFTPHVYGVILHAHPIHG